MPVLHFAALTDPEFIVAALAAAGLAVALVKQCAARARAAVALAESEKRAAKERERASIAQRDLEAERARMEPIAAGHRHLLVTLARGFQDLAAARDAAAVTRVIAETADRVCDPSQLMVFTADDASGKEFALAAVGGQRGSPWRPGARINDTMGRIGLAARRRATMDRNQFDAEPPIVRDQLDATEPADFVVEVVVPVMAGGNVAAIISVGGSTLSLESTRAGLELLAAQAAAQLRAIEASARIDRLRNSDDLTGLGSKGHLLADGSETVFRCRNENAPAALVVLGIDDFAGYVTRTGHGAGDRLLKSVADVLRANCAKDVLLARWSGAEFMALVPRTTPADARKLADRLRAAVAAIDWPKAASQPGGRLTMSAGIALLPGAGKNLDELIEAAAGSLASARWKGDSTVSSAGEAVATKDAPTQEAPTSSLESGPGRTR